MRPNLLHLTWDSPDNPWCGGGGAFRDYKILEQLQGWDREIWSGRHPSGSIAPLGVVRRDLGIGWMGEFVSRRTWGISASRLLRQKMSAPPMILSHTVSPWAPVWESLAYQNRTLNVIHHIAGEEILRRLGPFGPSSLRYERQILAQGRYFSLSNRSTASRIREINPTARIELIPIGFDPPTFPPPTNRLGRDHATLVFLGRLDHRMKGLDRLFASFAELAVEFSSLRLIVAGRSDRTMDAWISNALQAHPARSRISIVPNPSDEQKYQILDQADIFCVASRFEGWCIAAVEAQSRGLPVVATRTDGLMDSVSDTHTGILVSNHDEEAVQAMAQGIRTLLTDPNRREAMGREAVLWAKQFTWEAATKATDSFLDEIRQSSR